MLCVSSRDIASFLAPEGRYVYRKGHSYNPKPQRGDMCVVNMVKPNLDVEYGNSTYEQTSNLGYYAVV